MAILSEIIVKSVNYPDMCINYMHFHIIVTLMIILIFKYFKLLKDYFIYFNLFIA